MKLFKKISSFVCATVFFLCTVALTGCVFDLGIFEDEKDYTDSFGTVSLTSLSAVRNYDVGEDFYNAPALEHFECHVVSDEYVTFALHVKRKMDIDEFELGIIAPENVAFEIKMFVGEVTPPFYNDFDDDGEETEMPMNYIAETTAFCSKDKWGSFKLSDFKNGGNYEDTVSVDDGDVITLMFLNNTAWGKALGLKSCELALTALLIRAE